MVRMGHASPKAALRYQHATRDRDAAIARALSELVEQSQPADAPAPQADNDRHSPKKPWLVAHLWPVDLRPANGAHGKPRLMR